MAEGGTFVGGDEEAGSAGKAEYLARKGEGVMDETEFNAVVSGALQESVQFVDFELSPERALATEYYLGKPFGNEEDGRSQVVLTEVRDAVDGMLPSFLRIFSGPEHTVEFVPKKADAVESAEQMTDYVRYVYEQDNPGFLTTLSAIKDGLIRKIGIVKWGWDDSVDTKAYTQQGITRDELELLADDDDVELTSAEEVPPTKEMQAEQKQAMEQWSQSVAQSKAAAQQQAQAQAQQPPAG